MKPIEVKSRHHIYTGYREDSKIKNERQAGEAYEVEGATRTHYLVKMWAFPREEFYLVPNAQDGNYTLFAKKVGEGSSLVFRRPVGFGLISNELKHHLEIQFTFPRQRVFMSLHADKITVDSLLNSDGGVS